MSKKTISSLKKLTKIKKYELDEKRQALIEMQRKLQVLYDKVKQIHQQQDDEIEAARQNSLARANLPIYLQGLRKKQDDLKQQIYRLADFMIPIEESVREAFKEVKALELVIKNLHDKALRELEKAEQNAMDELTLQRKSMNTND